jgi:GTP-binding protein EngB required for normal cell division
MDYEPEQIFTYDKIPCVKDIRDAKVLEACMILCEEVYSNNPLENLNHSNKYPDNHLISKVSISNPEVCSQVFAVAELEGEKHVVIAFRGSQTFSDILVDSNILRMPSSEAEGSYHRGFGERASEIPIEPFIDLLNEGYKITTTGHSMGGAVAMIFTIRLIRACWDVTKTEDINCYTFGSPPCIDQIMSDYLRKRNFTKNFVCFVQEDDPVPVILSIVETIRKETSLKIRSANDLKEVICFYLPSIIGWKQESVSTSWFSLETLQKLITGKKSVDMNNKEVKEEKDENKLEKMISMISKIAESIGKLLLTKFIFPGNIILLKTEERRTDNVTNIQHLARYEPFLEDPNIEAAIKRIQDVDAVLRGIQRHRMLDYLRQISLHLQKTFTNFHQSQQKKVDKCNLVQVPYSSELQHCAIYSKNEMKGSIEIEFVVRGRNASFCRDISHVSDMKRKAVRLTQQSHSNKTVFSFCLNLVRDIKGIELEVACFFNTFKVRLENILHSQMLGAKKERLADLELVKLYNWALNFSLFSGIRKPQSVDGTDYHSEEREIVKKILYDMDNIWKDEQLEKIDEISLKGHWQQQLNTLNKNFNKTINQITANDESITFPSENRNFSEVIKTFEYDSSMTVVQATASCFPYMVALPNHILKKRFKVNRNREEVLFFVGAVLVVSGIVGTIVTLGMSAGVVLPSLAAISQSQTLIGSVMYLTIGTIVIASSIRQEMDTNYRNWLNLFTMCFNISLDFERSTFLNYEEHIYEYAKSHNILDWSNDMLITNGKWENIFQKGELKAVIQEDRKYIISMLRTICNNYLIRNKLATGISLGIVGESNSGKSWLSYCLFECGDPTKCGAAERTRDMHLYYRTKNFSLIDFPHIDSESQLYKACFVSNHPMVDLVILVINCMGDTDRPIDSNMIENIKSLDIPFLICLNQADRLLQKEASSLVDEDLPFSLRLLRETEGVKEKEINKADIEGKLKAAVQKYNVQQENLMMTCFRIETEGVTRQRLIDLGIKSSTDVRNWVFNQLEKGKLLKKSELDELKDYMKEDNILQRHRLRRIRESTEVSAQ